MPRQAVKKDPVEAVRGGDMTSGWAGVATPVPWRAIGCVERHFAF